MKKKRKLKTLNNLKKENFLVRNSQLLSYNASKFSYSLPKCIFKITKNFTLFIFFHNHLFIVFRYFHFIKFKTWFSICVIKEKCFTGRNIFGLLIKEKKLSAYLTFDRIIFLKFKQNLIHDELNKNNFNGF